MCFPWSFQIECAVFIDISSSGLLQSGAMYNLDIKLFSIQLCGALIVVCAIKCKHYYIFVIVEICTFL